LHDPVRPVCDQARHDMTQTRLVKRLITCAVLVVVCASGDSFAQGRQAAGRPGAGRLGPAREGLAPGAPADGGISPADLQELMDAMVVVQAERDLELSAEQFPQFLTRLRGLQQIRRRSENQRNRSLMELRRLTQPARQGANAPAPPPPDDSQIRDRLKALDDAEAQASAEIKQARTSLEQILNVRQQARFRLLEEQVERRKLELFARSRQPAPPK